MTSETQSVAAAYTSANFVERFEAAWNARDPTLLADLLDSDVVLYQPLIPPLRGREAAVRSLSSFLRLVSDLEMTVHDSIRQADRVWIEFSFRGYVGRRRVEWRLVDWTRLSHGRVSERRAYFDPIPLIGAVLVQPRLWHHLLDLIPGRRST